MSTAMKRLLIAAEKGDAGAQFNLGVMYDNRLDDNGHAIGGNRVEAMKWLLLAAEQGLTHAQIRLAEMYAENDTPSGDDAEACRWFLIAIRNAIGAYRQRAMNGYEALIGRMTEAEIEAAADSAGRWEATRVPEQRKSA